MDDGLGGVIDWMVYRAIQTILEVPPSKRN